MRRRRRSPRELEGDFVDVAPVPLLARLVGAHHRVAGALEMGSRVPCWGRVATTHVAALLAAPEVYPVATPLRKAILAAWRGRGHLEDVVQMSASAHCLPPEGSGPFFGRSLDVILVGRSRLHGRQPPHNAVAQYADARDAHVDDVSRLEAKGRLGYETGPR